MGAGLGGDVLERGRECVVALVAAVAVDVGPSLPELVSLVAVLVIGFGHDELLERRESLGRIRRDLRRRQGRHGWPRCRRVDRRRRTRVGGVGCEGDRTGEGM
ncbi:MAG: hypothetical protein U5N53_02975 [Mycobacterium sp.]|nr:hypothetical protein [Mycobacterium sp.]